MVDVGRGLYNLVQLEENIVSDSRHRVCCLRVRHFSTGRNITGAVFSCVVYNEAVDDDHDEVEDSDCCINPPERLFLFALINHFVSYSIFIND